MIGIQANNPYVKNQSLSTSTIGNVKNQDGIKNNSKDNEKSVKQTDSIEISDESRNLTKGQRAKKAEDEAIAEEGGNDPERINDIIMSEIRISSYIIGNNIHPVPRELLDPDNKTSFTEYAELLKKIAKQHPKLLKISLNDFCDFCDKLKENYKKNNV